MKTKKPVHPHKNATRIVYTNIIIICLFSVMLLSISGCIDSSSNPPVTSVTLTTDKDTYRSSEEMVITVGITASRDVDTAVVNISGIKNTFERNLLEESKIVSLISGDNLVEFKFETPSCSNCSGVPPGNHNITAVVAVDKNLYNITTIVRLEADEAETEGVGNGIENIGDN